MALKDEFSVRKDKADRLRQDGVDPYPARSGRGIEIGGVLAKFDELADRGEAAAVAGRVMTTRIHGKMAFADLRDESGTIQIQLTPDRAGEEPFARFVDFVDPADFIQVSGTLFLTKKGQRTIAVADWRMLAKALRPLPEKWHGLKDVEIRYRERELDLIANPEVREVFRMRTKIIRALREALDAEGFEEVETPVLQPIAGGATARPFMTHHNALDHDFYLRIAPELYLKRCVVGGYEKVYEIGRLFRNEGVDWSHNPEFTSLEFYWAYSDYEELMSFTEKFLSGVIRDVFGSTDVRFDGRILHFAPPWPRVKFRDAVRDGCGIDISGLERDELLSRIRAAKVECDCEDADICRIYDELYKETVRKRQIQPMFITDYPVEMEPLAKKCEDDPRFVQRFQLIASGFELLKAYSELNDPIDQRERFEAQQRLRERGNDEAQSVDERFLSALEHGLPPTAGWGMGIDRFVMLLTDQKSIKDVILFPTLKPEYPNSEIRIPKSES
jgi:lysyl-tRNA synthetase class 2